MKSKRLLASIFALALATSITLRGQDAATLQAWTSKDGRVIQAKFVKLVDESVVIEKDGKEVAIPFAKLNADSVTLAKKLSREASSLRVEAKVSTPDTKPAAYNPGREMAKLANQAITESSGLACSRAMPGVFWTHNDSGDQARLFAFNLKGENLGTYPIQGASAQDWEDMCSFSIAGKHFLLVADTGDNKVQRKNYTLYIAHEPAINTKQAKGQLLSLFAQQDFTYEDGPHNCESVAVDPVRREIVLVSKTSESTCKAYVLPLPSKKNSKKAVAKPVATLTIPTTSAMDISPDGLRALVLTYGDAYEYTRQPDECWSQGFARQPRIIKMPARAQGESVCYGPDGVTIYLTSEKTPTPLLEVTQSNPQRAGKP